jgi:hypothetical protein
MEALYKQPVNGTVYIRINQSKEIMKSEVPDIPEIRRHNELVQMEIMPQSDQEEDKNEEPVFKCPDTTLIPWISSSTKPTESVPSEIMEAVNNQTEVSEEKSDFGPCLDDCSSVPTSKAKEEYVREEPTGAAEFKSGTILRPLKNIPSLPNRELKEQANVEIPSKFNLAGEAVLRFPGSKGVFLKN